MQGTYIKGIMIALYCFKNEREKERERVNI